VLPAGALDRSAFETGDGEAAFLAACAAIDAGAAPEALAPLLAKARARAPAHLGLALVSAEVAGALSGPEARLSALRDVAAALGPSALLHEATAGAYRLAGRTLEAKAVLFELVRQDADAPVADELRDVLAAEASPLPRRRKVPPRAPLGSLLPLAGVRDRAAVLLSRAPAGAVEAEALERALATGDDAAVRAAELALVAALGGTS
jgi:hypothetical protein